MPVRFSDYEDGVEVSSLMFYDVHLPSRYLGVIEEVQTKEGYRKQGRATKLIKRAIERSMRLGCDCVELTVRQDNKEVQDFYKSLGFTDRMNLSYRLKVEKPEQLKACKIIAVSFLPGRDSRNNVHFPNHNQIGGDSEDIRRMVEAMYDMEVKEDAGIPLDIYIINNDVGFDRGNRWLDTINGTETRNGTLYVLNRENIGGSFGAYDYAFKKLRNKYDYFMFCEDDIFIFGKNYYRKMIKYFEKYNLGFLSLIDIEWERGRIHAHGGIGVTTREILDRVVLEHGELPHYKGDWDKREVIRQGEIPFTGCILEMGYEIDRFGTGEWNQKNHVLPHFNYINTERK